MIHFYVFSIFIKIFCCLFMNKENILKSMSASFHSLSSLSALSCSSSSSSSLSFQCCFAKAMDTDNKHVSMAPGSSSSLGSGTSSSFSDIISSGSCFSFCFHNHDRKTQETFVFHPSVQRWFTKSLASITHPFPCLSLMRTFFQFLQKLHSFFQPFLEHSECKCHAIVSSFSSSSSISASSSMSGSAVTGSSSSSSSALSAHPPLFTCTTCLHQSLETVIGPYTDLLMSYSFDDLINFYSISMALYMPYLTELFNVFFQQVFRGVSPQHMCITYNITIPSEEDVIELKKTII